MKLCFRFVAKLSTKMQNETQFLINFIVKINIKKFQQFFKIDFSRPLKGQTGRVHCISNDPRPHYLTANQIHHTDVSTDLCTIKHELKVRIPSEPSFLPPRQFDKALSI